jgi:hypothetical protein
MAHLDAVIKVDEEMLQRLIKQHAEPLIAVADAADELFDRLFLEQDLWSDPRFQHIREAAVAVDKALARLERETDYVRQDNRAE